MSLHPVLRCVRCGWRITVPSAASLPDRCPECTAVVFEVFYPPAAADPPAVCYCRCHHDVGPPFRCSVALTDELEAAIACPQCAREHDRARRYRVP